MYDAIDTDNEGTLPVPQVIEFVQNFLEGHQVEGQLNTSFKNDHDEVFKTLEENEQILQYLRQSGQELDGMISRIVDKTQYDTDF